MNYSDIKTTVSELLIGTVVLGHRCPQRPRVITVLQLGPTNKNNTGRRFFFLHLQQKIYHRCRYIGSSCKFQKKCNVYYCLCSVEIVCSRHFCVPNSELITAPSLGKCAAFTASEGNPGEVESLKAEILFQRNIIPRKNNVQHHIVCVCKSSELKENGEYGAFWVLLTKVEWFSSLTRR